MLYPLFANLQGRPVLVVGGGAVALRKCIALHKCGAEVQVVAVHVSRDFAAWARNHYVSIRNGAFNQSMLDTCWLVVAATDDRELNARVAAAAERRCMFVNVVDDAELSSFHVPAVVDRSPLTIAISSGGSAPMLVRELRERLESLVDHTWGRLAQLLAVRRQAIRATFPGLLQRRRFYRQLFDARFWGLLRANRDSVVQNEFDKRLAQPTTKRAGFVSLVGAGPGDPGLLTINGLRRLNEADVVLYDRLVDPRVLELARRDAEFVCVGKKVGAGPDAQRHINRLMLERARRGEHVVRLKGGDPFVFGRGGEELQFLRKHGVDYEVVPGITAALACAAYAGIPLTHRDHSQSVQLLAGHRRAQQIPQPKPVAPAFHQTLAIYMGASQVARIRADLLNDGYPPATPVAMVENGTRTEQRVLQSTIADMNRAATESALGSPALLIVGEVAVLASQLAWFGMSPADSALQDAA